MSAAPSSPPARVYPAGPPRPRRLFSAVWALRQPPSLLGVRLRPAAPRFWWGGGTAAARQIRISAPPRPAPPRPALGGPSWFSATRRLPARRRRRRPCLRFPLCRPCAGRDGVRHRDIMSCPDPGPCYAAGRQPCRDAEYRAMLCRGPAALPRCRVTAHAMPRGGSPAAMPSNGPDVSACTARAGIPAGGHGRP